MLQADEPKDNADMKKAVTTLTSFPHEMQLAKAKA
jgi:hypothetical protein